MPHSPLRRLLLGRHRAFLRAWVMRYSLRAAAAGTAAVAAGFLLGAVMPSGETAAWVRLGLVLALAATGAAFAVFFYLRAAEGFDSYMERIERSFPELRSWLRNAVELQSAILQGTSRELARALSEETAHRVARAPLRILSPRIAARRPFAVMFLSLIAIVGVGLAVPERAARSWATLWNPRLAAPPVSLEVEPGSVKITPGAALAVRARVWGSSRRPELVREGTTAPLAASEGSGEGGSRLWRFDLTQLTREQDYRVRVGRVESPLYRISLAGEPMPLSFEIEYQAPAYARLPTQKGAATRGDLSALRGTRAKIEVTFDRDLAALGVTVPGGKTSEWSPITERRWRGVIPIEREGEYELHARAASGEGRFRYRIVPLADAPPVVAVRVPTGDLDLPAGQQVPVEVLAQDDLGLSELKLQYRKDPTSEWTDVPLARFGDNPREATVRDRWDASPLGLLPGETTTFRFELYDNNGVSGRGRTVSPSFELRFPSLAELYENLDRRQSGIQTSLEKAAEKTKELQESLDRLAQQPVRSSPQTSPAFERSEELKSALQRQQDLVEQIERATHELNETLEHAAERQAFNEELTRKLREMAELMRQIQSREFQEAVRRMQEALERLDRRSLEQELPEWRTGNREMLANLERTIELLKQLRKEERLEALAKRAEELKSRQDALNREHERHERAGNRNNSTESQALAEQQERAADQTERLARDTRDTAQGMDNPQDQQNLEDAASDLESGAAPQQREASQSASQRQHSRGRQKGQQASQSLQRVAERLSDMVEQLRQQREGVDLAALRRSAKDLVSLQREAEDNLGSTASMGRRADRQTDLAEGVGRVTDSLHVLARKTPFIGPKLSEALGRAMNSLSTSGKDLGQGNRQRGEEFGRIGNAALNEAVLELRKAEGAMCQNPGQSGGEMPGTSQRLGEVGEKQAQLNAETRSLAQRLSEQLRLSAGDREQLQRHAEEQRRLREQLEQIARDDETRRELLGRLDAAQREMEEVEEALRSGRTDGDLEQKQTRILSRLLDAQRSINRRDFDPERESRPGEDARRVSAPELPAEMFRETDRLRLDLLKAEADRYPAQYRTFIEAYLRSLSGSPR